MTRAETILRWLKLTLAALFALLVVGSIVVYQFWQQRADIDAIQLPYASTEPVVGGSVTVTWLGTSTLLFDDGETQVLIDGTFTRLNPLQIVLPIPVSSDVAAINHALAEFRVNRLAAIVPVHSHFDHAMDTGYVANRTTAVVLGSESTANIARGADVPVDQYQTLGDGEMRQFGDFEIRLIASTHSPIGFKGREWFAGTIDEPLRQPARVSEWKTGVAWAIFISHPRGTALVQGSGGFVSGKLDSESADVVMLGVAALKRLGKEYVNEYWNETVVATGARRVLLVHHDDYTAPFGEIRLFPLIADDVVTTAGWIKELSQDSGREIRVELPQFGQPIPLF